MAETGTSPDGEKLLEKDATRRQRRPSKQPYLPVPGQATMIRESTRRRRGRDLLVPYNDLLETVGTMRRIRKHREKQFGECHRCIDKGFKEIMKLSEGAHYLFHEMEGSPVEEAKEDKKRAREADSGETEGNKEEDAETPSPKRRRTRKARKLEAAVLRNIGHLAEHLGKLKKTVDAFEVEHERDVQRTARDQLEHMAECILTRDKEHDKLIAGWQTLRMGKEATTFVAAHSNNTPCRIQWSPYAAFDPQIDQLQATEAAQRRRKSLSVATYLEDTHGKRAGETARHPTGPVKLTGERPRIRRFKTPTEGRPVIVARPRNPQR